ncbi:MAG: hypothetical protein LBE12_15475 [Planctomycetaceae bacterium]|jgi:hypothetical protein|nr:hypothetical protein [Planctomycetaceae bacterium]
MNNMTLNDIIAGFKYNASSFDSSRIIFVHNKSIVGGHEETACIDYWGDDQRFICRYYPSPDMSKFQISNLCETNQYKLVNMLNINPKSLISSYDDQTKIFLLWSGCIEKQDSKRSCMAISGSSPETLTLPAFKFPPLTLSCFEKMDRANPIVSFFLLPPEEMNIIGYDILDSTPVVILQHKSNDIFPIEGVTLETWTTAWIDTIHGFLPLRIDVQHFFLENDHVLPSYPPEAFSMDIKKRSSPNVFTCTKIEKQENGGYYPMIMAREILVTALKHEQNETPSLPTLSDLNARIKKYYDNPISLIPTSIEKWEVVHCSPYQEITSEITQLDFPNGTRVLNRKTGKINIVGMTDIEYEKMLRDEEEKSRLFGTVPDSGMNGILPDPNTKWNAEDYILRAPRGYRSAFLIIGLNLIVLGLIIRYYLLSRKRPK